MCGNGGYFFELRCFIVGCLLLIGIDVVVEKIKKIRMLLVIIIFDFNCRVDIDVLFKIGVEIFESLNGIVLEVSDVLIM